MRTVCLTLSLIAGLLCGGAAAAAERNAVVAEASGAQKGPDVCTDVYQPVCGTDASGKRVTYSNACFARMAQATNVTPGACQ